MNLMNKLKKILMKPSQIITNRMLFEGCETGDVDLVKKALALGANVNATKKVGKYWDGISGRDNPSWEGSIKVTPLICAATSAFEKEDERPYKEIIRLLAEQDINPNRVIAGTEKYWDNDQWELNGYAPDKIGPYAYTLSLVLQNRSGKKNKRYNDPYEYCSISDSMASYIAGMFGIEDQKVPDKLASKEAFLNDTTEKLRKSREKEVFTADVILHEPLNKDEVIKLRNNEERERLKANRLRMKLRQRVR